MRQCGRGERERENCFRTWDEKQEFFFFYFICFFFLLADGRKINWLGSACAGVPAWWLSDSQISNFSFFFFFKKKTCRFGDESVPTFTHHRTNCDLCTTTSGRPPELSATEKWTLPAANSMGQNPQCACYQVTNRQMFFLFFSWGQCVLLLMGYAAVAVAVS